MTIPGRTANVLARLLPVVAGAVLLAGCGYIVTPEDESSPTSGVAGSWTGIATKVEAAGGGLHVDLTLRNDTGAWSAVQASDQPTVLTNGDGSRTNCATVVVGTGGTSIPPGFQVRGYTGGTKQKPETQLLAVDCAGAAASPGAKLAIPIVFVTGDFNYYSPVAATKGTLDVPLDAPASDLTYPVAATVAGVIEPATTKIEAINHTTLTLTDAKRTGHAMELAWQADNPTGYPTYVHIGTPPVVGSDGVIYGFYESPHLADTPIAPAGESAEWTTTVDVPKDVTGLYALPSVESKQQKNFTSHAIDITDR